MIDELSLRSNGPAETAQLGARLAPHLAAGDVVLLCGDLGVGKTAFTQGLARAAGVTEPVTSPTFTLLHSYRTGRGLDLLHVDVYRLDRLEDIAELGVAEMLEEGAFALIEWGERAVPALGPEYLVVTITLDPPQPGIEVPGRQLSFRPHGPGWQARWPVVAAALGSSAHSGGPVEAGVGTPG